MKHARALAAAAVFAVAFATYAPTFRYGLVNWDDFATVRDNPILKVGVGPELVRRAFEPYQANWIPLTWISLATDRALFGDDPGVAHAVNAAWHAATAALLFAALARATGAALPALLVALSFALHPLRVESVAWVTERKDVLSGFFFAAAVAAWLAYGRRPGVVRYVAALAAAALSLLAKATAVTLPFVLLLLDLWPLDRLRDRAARRRAVLEKLPFAALAIAVSLQTIEAQGEGGAFRPLAALPLDVRAANAAMSALWYVEKALWPVDLAAFYPHPRGLPPADALGLTVFTGAALTIAVLALARRRPWLAVGWLWFLGMLVPMSGIVQVGMQARADRYAYLPLLGLEIAIAYELWAWLGRRPATRAAYAALTGAAAFALALGAQRQIALWRDAGTLFGRALEVTADNFVAHEQVGRARLAAGDAAEAARHFSEALRVEPQWARARSGLALALGEQGRRDEALWNHREAVRLDPTDGSVRLALAAALIEAGWTDDAITELRVGVRRSRDHTVPAQRMALAAILAKRGNREGARRHAERALLVDPTRADAHALLAALALEAGDAAAAEASLRSAIARAPDDAALRAQLGHALQRRRRDAEAIAAYREALARDAGLADARNDLAWLLAASRDASLRRPEEALRLAEANAADADASRLDTLAVALAANGRFADALAVLDRAEAALGANDAALARDLAARRRAFAAAQPWIEEAAP